MFYTHPVPGEKLAPDGSNWRKHGFWAYGHIVQQSPESFEIDNRIQPGPEGTALLSVNFDERLSTSLNLPAIDHHIQLIAKLGGRGCTRRTKKAELELGFTQKRDSLERILYFYCHGYGSSCGAALNLGPPYLVMTDDVVSASDFEHWGGGAKLPMSPLVFINACQGGQMTNMFYDSFAVELLRQGAVGLIGAQIDVPAIFAAAFGQLLLGRFLGQSNRRIRLGPLLREINRTMWDEHNNPLGLVYSLYRGVDCFVDW
jgi:hypothetical protein